MQTPLLDIEQVNLQFQYPILTNISYKICEGDFIILLGSNGSGKTSLLRLIDRRYQVSTGKIFLNEKQINHYPTKQFSRLVKTLTQQCHETLFSSLTILENYLIVKQQHEPHLFSLNHHHDHASIKHYLSTFNIKLGERLHQVVDGLSGGEKQALALALTVLYPPKILLLDEHTSALDPGAAEALMVLTQKIVDKYKLTCLLTTHDLDKAISYGNRILALKNGHIHCMLDNTAKASLSKEQLLTMCY